MKKFIAILTIAAVAAISVNAADEKAAAKERTIKGETACTKCNLKETDSCSNAVKATMKNKDGKEVTRVFYLEQNDISKENHGLFCKGGKEVTVKGTIKREGKGKEAKSILTASMIKEGTGK